MMPITLVIVGKPDRLSEEVEEQLSDAKFLRKVKVAVRDLIDDEIGIRSQLGSRLAIEVLPGSLSGEVGNDY